MHAIFPNTIPKQWYKGTGIQILSLSVSLIFYPIKKPLFKILTWDRVAPFGDPVVPEVNYILVGSSGLIFLYKSLIYLISFVPTRSYKSLKFNIPGVYSSSNLITYLNEGTWGEFNSPGFEFYNSGTISFII